MLIEIKSWITESPLYSCDADDLKSAIIAAVRSRVNLSGGDLSGVDLSGVDLSRANLDLKHCYLSISPIGSENGRLWTMKNEKGILIYNRGCFSGTEDEFRAAIDQKHGNSEYAKKYYAAIDFIKNQLGDRL